MSAATPATVRVMSPEEIVSRAGDITPPLHWPQRARVFAEREMRLRQLAQGHAMGDFLAFMADLARAQQEQLGRFPAVPVPDAAALDRASQRGVPPIPAHDWPRDPVWHQVLRALARQVRARAPEGADAALDKLIGADETFLERQADALLHGVLPGSGSGLDLACAPIVGAALQVYWTHMLLTVQGQQGPLLPAARTVFGRLDDEALCPCCGSQPTASLTRTAGASQGQRYLHCSLCNLQWHMARTRCTHCLASTGLAYQSVDVIGDEGETHPAGADDEGAGSRAAQAVIQAETCDLCHHYLKIMHTDRDAFVDPVADDLASLTLDLLVSETGQHRHGVNLMLLFGDPDTDVQHPPDPGGG
jgi:FdhE protein